MRALLVASLLLLVSASAQADVLFAATGQGATSNLYVLSLTNGSATTIGPIGQGVTGLAFDRSARVMYGVTTGGSACSRCLIRIDMTTGGGAPIGPLGLTISELEFGADGLLYGWSESSDELARINTTTGVATTIPGSGIGTFGDGMALVGNAMYVMPQGDTGTFYTVNTGTGTVAAVGTLSGSPVGGAAVSAAATDPSTNIVFAGINNFGAPPGFLVTVNVLTGVMTTVGPTVTAIDALAFGPDPFAVPTASEWALILTALALAAVGMRRLRG